MCGRDVKALTSGRVHRVLSELKFTNLPKRALRARRVWERVRRELLPEVAAWAAAGSEWREAQLGRLPRGLCWRQVWLGEEARPCANLGCTNVSGASEERLGACTRRCGGCGFATFCSEACCDAAWPEHSLVCGQQTAWLLDMAEQLPPEAGEALRAMLTPLAGQE